MKLTEYTIQYKRTPFDDVRTIKVFALSMKEAIETATECDGSNITIVSVSKEPQ